MTKSVSRALALALFLIAIDVSARFTPAGQEHWHFVLHRLYYFAIIGAGLSFGWAGGLIAAIASSISYLTQSQADSPDARNALDRYLENTVFWLVGLLAGILADRERAQRKKTERARAELEVVYQELQNNLEHLKRAAKMSALGHLSAGLAHEIRNPLAAIEGAAAIIQTDPDQAEQRNEFIAIILKECRRLNRLLTDFLNFARPRAPELQPVSIPELIESVTGLVKQTAARSAVDLDVKIKPDLPRVSCDAEQIKQVLLNLLLNAVQAMPEGGTLVLTAGCEADRVVMRIRDTGPGVPQVNVESIYDPFFTTKPNGTGLGLAVGYQIMEQHGGKLLLEENSDSGACFAMLLPVNRTGDDKPTHSGR